MVDFFQNLIYISIALAVVGLGLSIFFFFFFNIPDVYALMTGKAKRKTIERMAEQNSRTGKMQYITGTIRDPSIPMIQHPADVQTAEIAYTQEFVQEAAPAQDTSVLSSGETSVLGMGETSVLDGGQTSVLSGGETAVLSNQEPQSGDTAGLAPRLPEPVQMQDACPVRFDITESTLVIHTNEII